MMSRRVRRAQKHLVTIGWPIKVDGKIGPRTREAIRDFQRGWAWRWPIRVNGRLNRRTRRTLRRCATKLGGRCSPHFRYDEFRSKGNGWIRVNRMLVLGLEAYRARHGATGIQSGYRDPAHNASVGGANASQHTDVTIGPVTYLGGNAANISNPSASLDQVRSLHAFSGIGYRASDGKVLHVDTRHDSGQYNGTHGSPRNPTLWVYR